MQYLVSGDYKNGSSNIFSRKVVYFSRDNQRHERTQSECITSCGTPKWEKWTPFSVADVWGDDFMYMYIICHSSENTESNYDILERKIELLLGHIFSFVFMKN